MRSPSFAAAFEQRAVCGSRDKALRSSAYDEDGCDKNVLKCLPSRHCSGGELIIIRTRVLDVCRFSSFFSIFNRKFAQFSFNLGS